jgi:hypothetical protein
VKIDIAKGDLQSLRCSVWQELRRLQNTPAGRSSNPLIYEAVGPQVRVLQKFIRKLNRALVEVHGHDCNAQMYGLGE